LPEPGTARDGETGVSDTPFSRLSLFDDVLMTDVKPTAVVDPWASGVRMMCVGCAGLETSGASASANANAPWVLQGTLRRRTSLGVLSAGFLGVRNSALPLSAITPLGGGDVDPRVLGTSGTSGFLPGSRWSLTAGIERTLATAASGASVGVTADVLVPVKSNTPNADDPRGRRRGAATGRLGLILRW
jgi:hypothetical protein